MYHNFCICCSLMPAPIVFKTLYLLLAFEIICTDVLPERFFNLRKNIFKNRLATPIFKNQPNNGKAFRRFFYRVRKTGNKRIGSKLIEHLYAISKTTVLI